MKKLIVVMCCVFSLLLAAPKTCPNCSHTFAEAAAPVEITSKTAILIDAETKTVLFEHNSEVEKQVASICKLMTILLTLEELDKGNIELNQMVMASQEASGMGGSQMFLDAHAQYSIADLLKGVIVASANDASVALAEVISGSEQAFVVKMNERAKQLGLNKTRYANATGLNAPDQFSTAKDTAILLSHVLPYEIYQKDSSIWMEDYVHPSGRKTELVNTNRLSKYFSGSTGGKTGFTDEAQFCLAASAKRSNMQLIGVVLGASSSKVRFNEVGTMLNYGFASFEKTDIINCSAEFATVPVVKSTTSVAKVFAQESFSAISKKGEKPKYETVSYINAKISAPSKAGDVVGNVKIIKDGEVVKEINLVITQDIKPISLIQATKQIISHWKK